MFECQGLTIKLDFEHNIKYEVFYYDENGTFLEKTGLLTEDYVNDDLRRIFARIVITPDWSVIDTNTHEIQWYEVNKYAKQLSFRVNEIQKKVVYTLIIPCYSNTNEFIENEIFEFEYGMTWRDWLNSEYNPGLDSLLRFDQTLYLNYNNEMYEVKRDDKINPNGDYIFSAYDSEL